MSRRHRSKQHGSTAPHVATQQVVSATSRGPQFRVMTLAGLSFLLALLMILLYLPVTGHPFINFDDGDYITNNPHLQTGLNIATFKWAITSFHYASNWHPLTWLVHALDFQLYGTNAGGHHATSMLLHAMNVVLLFLLLAMATKAVGRSFFVAALFAVHPLDVESVAWASELKNVLCTFFFLLTLGAYGWYTRKPRITRFILVFLLFSFGLAAKPMVITLPFVLLLLDVWPLSRVQSLTEPSETLAIRQRSWIFLILEKIPLFALSAASAWITIRGQTSGRAAVMIHPSIGLRLANALATYVTYIVETIVPVRLAPFYPFPINGVPAWQLLLSVIVLLAISGLVLRFQKQNRYLLTGWLWFLGTLVPVVGILQVGAQGRADRYTYIPMMGLLVMIVWGLCEIADGRGLSFNLRTVPALVITAVLFTLTVRQISYWDSSYDLWTHTLAVTENNATAEQNQSVELIRSGRIDEAYPHLRRAVELEPSDFKSRINLGNVYSTQGRHQAAIQEYETVLKKADDPRLLLSAAINAASSYRKLGDLPDAEASYRLALRISPDNPAALQGLNAISHEPVPPSTAPQN